MYVTQFNKERDSIHSIQQSHFVMLILQVSTLNCSIMSLKNLSTHQDFVNIEIFRCLLVVATFVLNLGIVVQILYHFSCDLKYKKSLIQQKKNLLKRLFLLSLSNSKRFFLRTDAATKNCRVEISGVWGTRASQLSVNFQLKHCFWCFCR